eukprot:879676-Pelagomonas_calceolata.AAC.1
MCALFLPPLLTGCSPGSGHQRAGGHAGRDELRLCHCPVPVPHHPPSGAWFVFFLFSCSPCCSSKEAWQQESPPAPSITASHK